MNVWVDGGPSTLFAKINQLDSGKHCVKGSKMWNALSPDIKLRHSTPGRSSVAGPAHKFTGFGATVYYSLHKY